MDEPDLLLLQDAMETTAQSEDKSIAEELLHFFVDAGEKEAFAAMLFTCYDLVQPDVALEVSASLMSHSCVHRSAPTLQHSAFLQGIHPGSVAGKQSQQRGHRTQDVVAQDVLGWR